jgi:uncharacterized protein YjbI with pentapeptide repeats
MAQIKSINFRHSEADLSEADLSEADLSEADLSEADLSEADLSEADLSVEKEADTVSLDFLNWLVLHGTVPLVALKM